MLSFLAGCKYGYHEKTAWHYHGHTCGEAGSFLGSRRDGWSFEGFFFSPEKIASCKCQQRFDPRAGPDWHTAPAVTPPPSTKNPRPIRKTADAGGTLARLTTSRQRSPGVYGCRWGAAWMNEHVKNLTLHIPEGRRLRMDLCLPPLPPPPHTRQAAW